MHIYKYLHEHAGKYDHYEAGRYYTSTPPMQKRTTKSSRNQYDMSSYSTTKKHEAITTNRTADVVLMSTTPVLPMASVIGISSAASYKNKIIL